MATPNDNATAHPAHQYDAEVRKVIPFYDAIQNETLDLVRSVAGEPALWVDTGAGTGALVERALAAFPRTRFVLADPSEAMLAQARLRLGGVNPNRVTVLPAVGSSGLSRVEPPLPTAAKLSPSRAPASCASWSGSALGPSRRRAP